MKFLFKFLVVQISCISLLAQDVTARGVGGGGGGGRATASRATPSRSAPASRNAFTGSKAAKPATRPSVAKPATRPATQPATRPSTLPADKPATLPSNRPATRPSTKPGNVNYPKPDKPMTLPATRPGTGDRPSTLPGTVNRPDLGNRPGSGEKPSTLPGTVNRPDLGNRPGPGEKPSTLPGTVNRPDVVNRPGGGNTVIGGGNTVVRPGQNTRPVERPNFDRPGNNRPGGNDNWWKSGNKLGSGNTQININNNFQKNVNWSTNRNNWGYNPWWNRPATRPWYGGSWNCGWNNSYYHRYPHYQPHYGYRPPGYVVYESGPSSGEMIAWGLVGWSLGKLIFDSGYNRYSNPSPPQPVPTSSGSQVTYNQPITVVAAESAPPDDAAIAAATAKSESFIVESQEAFKQKNYLAALEAANKAVGEAPGDGALHEYRALVLFALGKFGEAAGVLNPVLASGPGWDWTTMVTLYDAQETYTGQLQTLEKYVSSKPGDAAANFLLGYHYMVCGHLDLATVKFAAAAKLQPADSVSKELADLCGASSTSADQDAAAAGDEPPADVPAPEPVPLEKLTGIWLSDRGDGASITLVFGDDGKFTWTYVEKGKKNEFGGEFSMNDSGLLVMGADESQMVAQVGLPSESEMKFVLAGGPPGDPGLDFKKN